MAKIAVLLATYNGERFIADQLESLLNQTNQDFVCYIHDDASTDRTTQIIDKYERDYPNKIQILKYSATGSATYNFMSLLSKVDAQYYMFCDQDDVWLPEKIKKTYNKMLKIEEKGIPCAIFSDLCVVDSELHVISTSYMKYTNRNPQKSSVKDLLAQNIAAGCTMMINKQLRDMACQYSRLEDIIMFDWWAILIASAVGKIGYLDDRVILYRQHGNNQIGAKRNILEWALQKRENIIDGKQLQESKRGLFQQKQLASELINLSGLNYDTKLFLTQLVNIDRENKITRIKFYINSVCLGHIKMPVNPCKY